MHAVICLFPTCSYVTGKYYIATMTMITASTSLTIFIMNIHFCGAEAKPVPHWAKVLIIDYMAKVFFVYEVGENCTTHQNEHGPPFVEDPLVSLEHYDYFSNVFYSNHLHDGSIKPYNRYNNCERDCHHARNHQSDSYHFNTLHMAHMPPQFLSRQKTHQPNYMHHIGRYGNAVNPREEKLRQSELSIPEKLSGYTYEHSSGCQHNNEYTKPYTMEDYCKKTSTEECTCICDQHQQVVQNIEYIANCFREQRSNQAKGAEWKKVAKVMDRFFMWVFFIMVFLMSILIMAKAS